MGQLIGPLVWKKLGFDVHCPLIITGNTAVLRVRGFGRRMRGVQVRNAVLLVTKPDVKCPDDLQNICAIVDGTELGSVRLERGDSINIRFEHQGNPSGYAAAYVRMSGVLPWLRTKRIVFLSRDGEKYSEHILKIEVI